VADAPLPAYKPPPTYEEHMARSARNGHSRPGASSRAILVGASSPALELLDKAVCFTFVCFLMSVGGSKFEEPRSCRRKSKHRKTIKLRRSPTKLTARTDAKLTKNQSEAQPKNASNHGQSI
jgi:hypothetical protein